MFGNRPLAIASLLASIITDRQWDIIHFSHKTARIQTITPLKAPEYCRFLVFSGSISNGIFFRISTTRKAKQYVPSVR